MSGMRGKGGWRHTCPIFTAVFVHRDDAAEGSELNEIREGVEDRVGHYATKARR